MEAVDEVSHKMKKQNDLNPNRISKIRDVFMVLNSLGSFFLCL